MLSLREAGRRSRHDPKALRQAIADGMLGVTGDKVDEAELDRFIASLGTCGFPGCELAARYPSGCCTRGHSVAVAKATTEWRECAHPDCSIVFRPRPEQLAKGQGECHSRKCAQDLRRRREGAAGLLLGELVECACGCGQSRRVFPSQRTRPPGAPEDYVARYMFFNAEHWARYRWEHGIALKENVRGFYRAGQWSLTSYRRTTGRWDGRRGGTPRVEKILGADEVDKIRKLKAKHPEWGYGTIAAARSRERGDREVTLDRVRTLLTRAA